MRPDITLALLLLTCGLQAQVRETNLVPNPSFEKKIDFEQISDRNSWNKCLKDDTPDYFRFYSSENNSLLFKEFDGGVAPFDGKAYVGLFCYRINPVRGVYEVREFIQVKLNETLQKDSLYHFSMHVALDPESTHATRNFSVIFSDALTSEKHEKKIYQKFPGIRFYQEWIDDTTWFSLEADYKARGFEKYMIIGNSMSDKSTARKPVGFRKNLHKKEKWNLVDSEEAAYYYIDAVALSMVHSNTEQLVEEEPVVEHPDEPEEEITIDRVRQDSVFVLRKIFFEFDKSELLPESTAELNRLLQFLEKNPGISIMIEGHTDNVGSYTYNINLSERRARAVADYLVEHGIGRERLEYRGFGYTQPLTRNDADAGRALNRRVAFRIIE